MSATPSHKVDDGYATLQSTNKVCIQKLSMIAGTSWSTSRGIP